MVTGNIIQGSPSIGTLTIVYSLTKTDSSVLYNFYPHPLDETEVTILITGLPDDQYGIYFYAVEENTLPFHRAAATTSTVHVVGKLREYAHCTKLLSHCMSFYIIVEGDNRPHSSTIEYELHPTSTGVCITCTFLDSSTTDCVAVVHQRISLLNSSGELININESHAFSRSGDDASGCIEEVDLATHQVGVFGVSKDVQAIIHFTGVLSD